MHLPEVFMSRIAECERMAKLARDPDSKATWNQMAERWHRCAELEVSASLAAAPRGNRHRKSIQTWGHH
jgi:hypothetical protein